MASLGSQQYTVGTSPVLIAVGRNTGIGTPGNVRINNASATPIFLGGPHVTTANGFSFSKQNEALTIDLHEGDELYAVTASSTATVSVLQT